jgi:molybdate transport system substrate-binding protein
MSKAISGLSSMATQHVLAELARDHAQASGAPVAVTTVGGIEAAKRVRAGETWDFVVLAADAIAKLEAEGHVVHGTRADIARSGVAVAVPIDAPAPDLSSEAAVLAAVMNARAIGFSTGPSGTHLMGLFERWGIADAVRPRVVQAPPGVPVGSLVARGEADLGFQQLSELIHLRGIRLAGVLPAEIQSMTTFSGAVCGTSEDGGAARAFLRFLASAETTDCKRRHGMEPMA